MPATINYRNEIIRLTNDLPGTKLKELFDFALFLKVKEQHVALTQIKDSAAYVKKMRIKEGKKAGTGKKFIESLMTWQNSDLS